MSQGRPPQGIAKARLSGSGVTQGQGSSCQVADEAETPVKKAEVILAIGAHGK